MHVRPWLLLLALVSCSVQNPPLLGDPTSRAKPDASLDLTNDSGPPSCAIETPDRGFCSCVEVSLLTDVPNIYFVLDRSGSMSESNKWNTVRSVTSKVITQLGPRSNFAAAIFPGPMDGCAAGSEVMTLRPGDSPAGKPGPVASAFLQATSVPAVGGTPTAATLRSLESKLASLTGRTFVVLATDGGPNCNWGATCTASTCLPNIENTPSFCTTNGPPNCCDPAYYGAGQCLDEQPTIDAVTALAKDKVPTYVIGVPGSGPYSALLDNLATAGGTARIGPPKYYRVDSTDASAFQAALAQVAAKIAATCTFPLAKPPEDPSRVNVFIDDVPVPNDPVNGWKLDGQTVTLVGTTCDKVLAGQALEVRVVEGCPTITPN